MPTQSDLIGNHPVPPHPIGNFFVAIDKTVTATQCHRALDATVQSNDAVLIEWLARKIIYHHYDDIRLERLKEMYGELGFPRYAAQHRKIPRVDKTKKGNATEILLIEYIEGCLGHPLVKAFKLRYNTNVDQAMKGDDTLGVKLYREGDIDKAKIFMGESKFRQTSTKQVIDDITNSLGEDKKPLSFTFLVDELSKNEATKPIADIIDKLIIDDIKGNGDLIYTGFLLSNMNASTVVETHLSSNNSNLIFISVGINNPEQLINEAFNKAEELLLTPDLI